MFWILRRTGAANFFNSLNNNCNSSKGSSSSGQTTLDKYVKRPPRKAYGRLSADSDDAASAKHKADSPFDEADNFEMLANGNGSGSGNGTAVATNSICHNPNQQEENDGGGCGGGTCGLPANFDVCGCDLQCSNGASNSCKLSSSACTDSQCSAADCQGNYGDGNLCEYNGNSLCNGGGGGKITACSSSSSAHHHLSSKEVNENTINRLQSMAMSDDDDYDESLTCNVCDRAFHCHRQLASHQQKKRHFGCGGCDSLFPSLMLLEHHKEEFEHWSDDEISRRVCCRRNRGEDYFTDTDSFTSEAESEDLERLL